MMKKTQKKLAMLRSMELVNERKKQLEAVRNCDRLGVNGASFLRGGAH
jgi:hypothetical protein